MLVQTRVDPGFRTIDYDSKELRKPLRKAGNDGLFPRLVTFRAATLVKCNALYASKCPDQATPSRFIRRRLSECRFITRHLSFMGIVGQDQKRWSNRGVTKNDPVRR